MPQPLEWPSALAYLEPYDTANLRVSDSLCGSVHLMNYEGDSPLMCVVSRS